MKIKLDVSHERYFELKDLFEKCGFEVDDDADLVLSECNRFIDTLMVRDTASNEKVFLPIGDIVYIETYGHTVEVHTDKKTYQAFDRLYKIYSMLDPSSFLRISNSVVIAKDKVKQISTTLSLKVILTMSNGKKVDVTRNYYFIFKESFGI